MDDKTVEFRLDVAVVLALLGMVTLILLALVFVPIPDKNQTLFTSISTALVTGGLGSYFGYRWGSSKGSASKDATIADLTKAGQ